MRPSPGDDAWPQQQQQRARKPSIGDSAPHPGSCTVLPPTTFFFRTEDDFDRSLGCSSSTPRTQDSTYGVQSLEDTLSSTFGDKGDGDTHATFSAAAGKRRINDTTAYQTSKSVQSSSAETLNRIAPQSHVPLTRASLPSVSRPQTPPDIGSPSQSSAIASTPKSISIKSFRLSDEDSSGTDEVSSQVIVSSSEDEADSQVGSSGGFPELVMPSIQMPRRRPFTQKGKSIGRLRVLIAGPKGVGKTSLIRSMVQLCEDIVHVDPLSSYQPTISPSNSPQNKSRQKKVEQVSTSTSRITEIHASTKAYPPWWTEMEEVRVLRRRRNMGDTVLDRNVCFVDTPGLDGSGYDSDHVSEYIESLLQRDASITSLNDGDLLAVYSGNGGSHVDVVLYLFSHESDLTKDMEHLQRLSALTNVVPLISKSDTLTPAQLMSLKLSILSHLENSTARPFFFGNSLDESLKKAKTRASESIKPNYQNEKLEETQIQDIIPPYAVTSILCSDLEAMDASLLMSPEYVQPLIPSDLSALVSHLFDPDNVAWLRHSAAKKLLQWRRATKLRTRSMTTPLLDIHSKPREYASPERRSTISSPAARGTSGFASVPSSVLSSPSSSHSHVLVSPPSSSPNCSPSIAPIETSGVSDFTVARLRDHAQREEKLAQVRLAKWAADLQRALQNERDRFEQLQRAERAKWLLERVGEEVRDGTIVPRTQSVSPHRPSYKVTRNGRWVADWAVVRHSDSKGNSRSRVSEKDREWWGGSNAVDPHDPLGLCEWSDGVTKGSVVVLQVLGGVSIIGAVAVAVVKAWGPESIGVEGVLQWFHDMKTE